MKKSICDICKNDLYVENDSPLGKWVTVYEFKEITVFPFCLWNPITGSRVGREKMEVCSTCISDFKEFVQRKSDCFNSSGGKA